jgi:hypothetical protein
VPLHVPSKHAVPVGQQGPPIVPHSSHVPEPVPLTQTSSVPSQIPPWQHGPAGAPHASQMPPAMQTMLPPEVATSHVVPSASHVPEVSQHPVPSHFSGQQHGWPLPPHPLQEPPLQTVEAPEHGPPSMMQTLVEGSQQPA